MHLDGCAITPPMFGMRKHGEATGSSEVNAPVTGMSSKTTVFVLMVGAEGEPDHRRVMAMATNECSQIPPEIPQSVRDTL